MKNSRILLTLALTFLPAIACAAQKAKAADCARCEEIQKLEQSFLKLSYASEADRAAGAEKQVAVEKAFEDFYDAKKSPTRKDEFKALVNLVAAALPYDEFNEGSKMLSIYTRPRKDLRLIYERTVAAVGDSCRRQYLVSMMQLWNCYEDQTAKGKEDLAEKTCKVGSTFDYGACVGVKLEP